MKCSIHGIELDTAGLCQSCVNEKYQISQESGIQINGVPITISIEIYERDLAVKDDKIAQLSHAYINSMLEVAVEHNVQRIIMQAAKDVLSAKNYKFFLTRIKFLNEKPKH